MTSRIIDTDVLVAGGGGAGFRSAIGARQKGVRTVLVSKGPLGRCGATPMAGADYTLDGHSMSQFEGLQGDPNDSPEKVFNDIVTQGWFINNQKLVEQYIRMAPQCLRELIEWGIQIKLSDERMIFTSGTGIMDALVRKARSLGVELLEDIALLELVTQDGQIAGALGLDIRTGEFVQFRAKAVVMATGGWHKAFWPNTGMRDLSGEGVAMAHRAGADLGNMEFITFCCNVFLDPPIWRGSIAPYLLSSLVGGRLTNGLGDEFLQNYDPFVVKTGTFTEWNKSFISHTTTKEVRAGRGFSHGGIHYSRGNVPWENIEAVGAIVFPKWRYKALDLTEWGKMLQENKAVEVGSAVEYFEGGIVVDEHFESTLPGLFAAGECALGAFGANRVFAATTEMMVQGADAGASAGDYANRSSAITVNPNTISELEERAEASLHRTKGLKPAEVRRKVQETAHKQLGPIRTATELKQLISFLENVEREELPRLATTSKSQVYNKEWLDALELGNMLQLLKIAASSALIRTESRGVHYREDYPDTDNENWLKESIVKRSGDSFTITRRPVTTTSMVPPTGKTPYLDFTKKLMEAHSDTGGKH